MSSAEPCYSWNADLRYLRDERDRPLEGFYSLLAGSVSRRFLAGVEIRNGIQGPAVMNAVINVHLRRMLVREDTDGLGLQVLRNSPSSWLSAGRRIRVRSAPTRFRPFNTEVTAEEGLIRARIDPPARQPVDRVCLHVRHPDGRPISRVTINGIRLDYAAGPVVEIRRPVGEQSVVIEF